MKKALFAIALVTIIASCKSKTDKTQTDSIATDTSTVTNTAANNLIDEFKPIIQGSWVKADWIDNVISTKSPLANVELAIGVTVMTIETDEIKGDSLKVNAARNNHEGDELTLRFKPGKNKGTIVMNEFELGYKITKTDTLLTLTAFSPKLNLWYTVNYKRAFRKITNNAQPFGLDYLLNKGLVAGRYVATDSLGKRSNVTFNANGDVNGLADFKKYFIEYDLKYEPMMNLDAMAFDLRSNKPILFAYKINKDTLSLFDTYPNADSTLTILGKLKYKLVRHK